MNPSPTVNPACGALDFAVVRLGQGPDTQVAIGALPRPGRLPLRSSSILERHIELQGNDGVLESVGSVQEPLDADVLAQARSPEGLWFAEIDEVTGAPVATERLLGGTR